jgi:hypothetical protein
VGNSHLLRGIAVIGALVLSQQALAAYIQIGGGDEPCGSCFGGVYTLSSELLGEDTRAGTETHRVTYTLDLSGYTGSQPTVTGLAYHVTNRPNFVSAVNHMNPTGDSDDWTQMLGNIAQCDGGRGFGGWVCLEFDDGQEIQTGTSTLYSWVSDVTVLSDGLIGTWSIQADFDPHRGMYLSESAAVPIPGALALFATALGLFGIRSRWQKKTAA